MGICGLSLMGYRGLEPVSPDLNISMKTKTHMKNLHMKWKQQKAQREEALQKLRIKNKSISTFDRTHIGTVILAFIIGLGAVVIPWIYSAYLRTS